MEIFWFQSSLEYLLTLVLLLGLGSYLIIPLRHEGPSNIPVAVALDVTDRKILYQDLIPPVALVINVAYS